MNSENLSQLSSYTLNYNRVILIPVHLSGRSTDISIRTAHFLDAVPPSHPQPAQEC